MPAGIADLLHDSAVLHKFAESIEQYCGEQKRSQTYVDASGKFFEYVEHLAAGIKLGLKSEVEHAKRVPHRLPVLQRKMLTLKYYLRLLHTLIKPAADAHTLSIPAPLIELASQQLQQVQGMRDSQIVILLTPALMYFQRPHTEVKEQARIVQTFVSGAVFPSKLGFIEVPYSQGTSFFTNLAIYHEIGHFVYEELSNQTPANRDIAHLHSATDNVLGGIFRNRQVLALATKIVDYWIQEIFCDLFALRLVGPAFSFALVEMLGMLGVLAEANVRFERTHPAPACRFAEHVEMLRADSWWDAIANVNATQKKLIEKLANVPRTRYTFYVDDLKVGPRGRRLVDAFLDVVVPAIRRVVRNITPDPARSVKQFVGSRKQIDDCFRAGVVPITKPSSPNPVSIINASFCFYLTSLKELITKFEDAEAENAVDTHSLWTTRLEMWTMKAIEDSQIQTAFRRVQRTPLWSSQGKK
jgi:hypothetical protein